MPNKDIINDMPLFSDGPQLLTDRRDEEERASADTVAEQTARHRDEPVEDVEQAVLRGG